MRQLFRFLLPLSLVCLLLSACGAGSPFHSLQQVLHLGKDAEINNLHLDPRYRYLRLTLNNGRSIVLILGYVDADALGNIETWYSLDGGSLTLRLQNGRLIGGSGWTMAVPMWTHVQFSAQPSWDITTAATFTRRYDAMPAYNYGRTDTLTLRPISAPQKTHLHGAPSPDWRWFEETSSGADALPASHYAIETNAGISTVVYGEQCLTKADCISWQRWPLYLQTQPSAK